MEHKSLCNECGKESVVTKTHEHTERVGNQVVKDSTLELPTCENCGDYSITYAQMELYELRAAVTVLMKAWDDNSPEAIYARKALMP